MGARNTTRAPLDSSSHPTMAPPSVECMSSKMKLSLIVTWIVAVLINDAEALAPLRPIQSVENKPFLPAFYQRCVASRRPRLTTTELPMGLRNILGKVRKKKDKDYERDNDDEDYSKPTPSLKQRNPSSLSPGNSEASSQVPPASTSTDDDMVKESSQPRLPVRMGMGKDGVFDVNLLDDNESVQERINRVKAGKMTVEEKLAFLNAALSTGNTPETRLPLRRPTVEPPPMDPVEQKKKRASPFPEDPILRSIAGGKDPGPAKLSQQIIDNAGIDSQKKKREYLDMVTDPHRFDVFRTQPRNARLNPMAPTQGRIADAQQQYDFRVPAPPKQPVPAPSTMVENPYLPMMDAPAQQSDNHASFTAQQTGSDTPKTTLPVYNDTVSLESASTDNPDLAYRLGAAAIVQEQQRIAQEQQREEQRKKEEEEKRLKALELEEQNREAAAQAAEEERRRQEILSHREKEYRDRRRKEEEAAAREAARLKEQEEQRLKVLMDAQQSYWEKKLARERELRENRLTEEKQQKRVPPVSPVTLSVPVESPPSYSPRPSPSLGGQNLSNHVFNPDERNILNEGGNERTSKKNSSVTDSRKKMESVPTTSFLNDVANYGLSKPEPKAKGPPLVRGKKQEEMDEQLRRLKELNSPLPSIPQGRYVDKKRNVPPASFQPQRPVSAYSSGPKPSSGSVNGFGTSPPARTSSSAQSSPPPALVPEPALASTPVKPRASSNPLNSLFGNQAAPAPAPRAVKPQPVPASPPERKGPIRMQLPINDDNEDSYDEEEGIDSRSNRSMSIADVKRRTGTNQNNSEDPDERSKKWYVYNSTIV